MHAANPALFNGRFFVLTQWTFAAGAFEGACVETDYASYLHWRTAGFPGGGCNAFAMAALHAADGGVLIGRMAPWTANAGAWYPPAGSLDAEDITPQGTFDLAGNMRRELREELGLDLGGFAFRGPWCVVAMRGRLAFFHRVALPFTGAELMARVQAHLDGEEKPELDAIKLVHRPADLDGHRVPPFFAAYLNAATP